MTKERFENGTNWQMTYEQCKACYCPDCTKEMIGNAIEKMKMQG